jgi:hypothetical protein
LAEPLPATAENVALVEGIGRTIQAQYDGDAVWDAARIMRLPGTINVPSPDKAAQGRSAAVSSVLPTSTGVAVTLDALRAWAPPTAVRAKQDAKLPDIDMDAMPDADDYDELPTELRERFENARNKDAVLDKLWGGQPAPEQKDISPSGFSYALAGRLKRAGDFTAIDFGAPVRVWDHRSEKEIDARRIARDWGNNPTIGSSSGFDPQEISNIRKLPASGKVAAAPPTDWNERTNRPVGGQFAAGLSSRRRQFSASVITPAATTTRTMTMASTSAKAGVSQQLFQSSSMRCSLSKARPAPRKLHCSKGRASATTKAMTTFRRARFDRAAT